MCSSEQVPPRPSSINLDAAALVKEQIWAASRSPNTLRNYRSSWRSWLRWCEAIGVPSMPATPALLVDYAAWCIAEGFRMQTVLCRIKGVNFYHRQNGIESPSDDTVNEFLRNAARHLSERPQGKHALTPELLRKIVAAFTERGQLIDIRDCVLVLLGFACGWRRSEIVSLDIGDVRWVERGITMWLGKSKTDQTGEGRLVGIFYGENDLTCPVKCLEAWLRWRGHWPGPLFTRITATGLVQRKRLDDEGVWRAVKRGLTLIGEEAEAYGAHSLRAGMITAAIEAGASETAVMMRTGQRDYKTLRRYVRPVRIFQFDPLAGVL